ncbi:hypothetical protein IAU59_003043 [Kwoniella sp. CBS 9459]
MVDLSFAASALSKLSTSLSFSLLVLSSSLRNSSHKQLPNVPSLADLRRHAEAISRSVQIQVPNSISDRVPTLPAYISSCSEVDKALNPTESRNDRYGYSCNDSQDRSSTPPPKYTARPNKLQKKGKTLAGRNGGRTDAGKTLGGEVMHILVPEHTYDSPDHRRLHSFSSPRKMDAMAARSESYTGTTCAILSDISSSTAVPPKAIGPPLARLPSDGFTGKLEVFLVNPKLSLARTASRP